MQCDINRCLLSPFARWVVGYGNRPKGVKINCVRVYNIHQLNSGSREMKVLTAATEKLLVGVKSVFLNPYHFTYVIHKEYGFIYLYDEMTM